MNVIDGSVMCVMDVVWCVVCDSFIGCVGYFVCVLDGELSDGVMCEGDENDVLGCN